MEEIAKEAGIGKATLFRYFPGKLELVIAVTEKNKTLDHHFTSL